MEQQTVDREHLRRSLATAGDLIHQVREATSGHADGAQEEARRLLENVRLHLKGALLSLAPNDGSLWSMLFSGAELELVRSGARLSAAAGRYDFVRDALAIILEPESVAMDIE